MDTWNLLYERLYLLLFILLTCSAFSVNCSNSTVMRSLLDTSSESGFHNVNIFSEPLNGYVGAFGDFNSDKYNDLFVISSDHQVVSLWLWQEKNEHFSPSTLKVELPGYKINSIEAADFDYDGNLDLLIQYSILDGAEADANKMVIHFGNLESFVKKIDLPPSVGEVMIIQMNDPAHLMQPRLLGNVKGDNGAPPRRAYWTSANSGTENTWNVEPCMGGYPPFSIPHSNAIVDLDGDCAADLFFTTKTHHEIWRYDVKVGTHVHAMNISLAEDQGLITFADIDGDGNIDALFPICHPADCSKKNQIRIVYNKQLKICPFFYSKDCRKSTNLCKADPNFSFSSFESNQTADVVTIQVGDIGKVRLNTLGPTPLRLRVADYNLDRFPDLLVPVISEDGSSYIQLWENVECTVSTCGKEATRSNRRTFRPKYSGLEDLLEIKTAFSAAWIDIGESASNDLIVMYTSPTNPMTYQVQGFRNGFYNDGYFIKLLGLNGMCVINCHISNSRYTNLYGVNQHGISFKYTLSDLDAKQVTNSIPQLSQSSYHSLQSPYTVCGIGRPGNYIDYVYIGIPSQSPHGHFRFWPGIIPNSQIVVVPYPLSKPSQWIMELYISPSGALVWIALAVCVSLVLSGICILALQYKERKEDELEKKRKAHLFSFRAL